MACSCSHRSKQTERNGLCMENTNTALPQQPQMCSFNAGNYCAQENDALGEPGKGISEAWHKEIGRHALGGQCFWLALILCQYSGSTNYSLISDTML